MYCMYSVSGHETMCTRAAHRADCFLARLLHEQAARRREMRLLILRLLVPHVLTYTSPRIVLRPLALHFLERSNNLLCLDAYSDIPITPLR